jgi:hypothetical protein
MEPTYGSPKRGKRRRGTPSVPTSMLASPPCGTSWASTSGGGNLVWIQGRYPTDIKIFNAVLTNFLEWYERVEANDGYHGHPNKVKCPLNDIAPAEKLAMQARVRARHKTINGCLKNWGILSQVFRHDIHCHGEVFRACAVLTQLTIEQGEPLFSVEYEDKFVI